MKHNCYNCKYKQDAIRNPFSKENYFCKKQYAWIKLPWVPCPKFNAKLWSKIFGDQSPSEHKEELVGGCLDESEYIKLMLCGKLCKDENNT